MNCNDISTFYPYLAIAGIIFAISIYFAFKCQDELQKEYPDKEDYLKALSELHKGGEMFSPEKPRLYQIISIGICAWIAFNFYQCVG